MKGICLMALTRLSGLSYYKLEIRNQGRELTLGFEALDDQTTVTAPKIANAIPMSSLAWNVSRNINGAKIQFAIKA